MEENTFVAISALLTFVLLLIVLVSSPIGSV